MRSVVPQGLKRLDALHGSVRSSRLLRGYTWAVRILPAKGFIPPGLIKVLDIPFTTLSPETSSVGYLFAALHQAGWLYEFIGVCQVLAGVLLLVPATATLGALAYLPTIAGIQVITVSMHFRGTWLVTSLMLLGVLYLLCWDWDRLKCLVVNREASFAS